MFPRCVIDAHGEQTLFGGKFDLAAGQKVVFYVPQGTDLGCYKWTAECFNPARNFSYSGSLAAIATGKAPEVERVTGPGKCPDYNLSKIQRSSASGLGGAFSNLVGQRNDITYTSLEQFLDRYTPTPTMDVVTVRNRGGKLAITLREVIDLLTRAGYDYDEFHCDFCRSSPFNPWAPKQVVAGSEAPGEKTY